MRQTQTDARERAPKQRQRLVRAARARELTCSRALEIGALFVGRGALHGTQVGRCGLAVQLRVREQTRVLAVERVGRRAARRARLLLAKREHGCQELCRAAEGELRRSLTCGAQRELRGVRTFAGSGEMLYLPRRVVDA